MHQEFEITYTYGGKYKKTSIAADTKDQALDYFDRNFLHDEVISVQGKIYARLY